MLRKARLVKRLYVGNLSWGTGDQELLEAFQQYGAVVSARVIMDRETQRSRGFGFVEMEDDAAEAAIRGMNGQELDGRALRVNEALPPGERPAGGGGYRGGGGGGGYGGDRGGGGGGGYGGDRGGGGGYGGDRGGGGGGYGGGGYGGDRGGFSGGGYGGDSGGFGERGGRGGRDGGRRGGRDRR
jgi:hypothetical protein